MGAKKRDGAKKKDAKKKKKTLPRRKATKARSGTPRASGTAKARAAGEAGRGKRKRPAGTPAPSGRGEPLWLGARYRMPVWIMEPEPVRPHIVLWLEPSSRRMVHHRVVHPEAPAEAFGRSLSDAIRASGATPGRIRVPEASLAKVLRGVVPPSVPIEIGPVEELDAAFEAIMAEAVVPEEERSYLKHDRLAPDVLARFFRAAASLYRRKPWDIVLSDDELFSVDAPAFRLSEACLCVIGQLGESFGILVFESLDDWRAYSRADPTVEPPSAVPLFAVCYDPVRDLPDGMRAEIRRYHWELAGPGAAPALVSYDPDFVTRPLTEKDYAMATACCEALDAFLGRHADAFLDEDDEDEDEDLDELDDMDAFVGPDPREPISDAFRIADLPGSPTIRLTVPHPGLFRWSP